MEDRDLETEFIRAYKNYFDAIFRHCYFRVFDRERAKELVQETFTRAWEYIASGKQVKNLRAFLYTTATHAIIDESRKRKTDSLDQLMELGFDVSGSDAVTIEHQIEIQQVLQCVQRLDEKYREVLVMRYIDDVPVVEIAAILSISPTAASVRIHRALKQLRKVLRGKPPLLGKEREGVRLGEDPRP